MSMCVRKKGRICGDEREREIIRCVCLLRFERGGGGGTKRGVSA